MKKMIGFISLLSIVLAFAFYKEKEESSAKDKENLPVVGILQLTSHPALDIIYEGIIDALEKEGFTDGETVTIDFQNAQGDQSNLNSMSTRFVSRNAALMIGIATPSAQALANSSKDIPIILGAVTDPEGAGLVKDNENPGQNITGVSDLTPIKEQFELIKEILPEAKKIGIIYSSSEDNSIVQAKQAIEIAESMGYETITSTVSSTNDVSQVSSSLVSQVDAVWVPTDNTIASSMSTLVAAADNSQIPIFPAVDTMVNEGGLATVGLNQYELGRLTGQMAATVLKGDNKPGTMPIQYLKEGEVIINLEKAEKLGITIPKSVSDRVKSQ
ncbi:putative ABC transport system substrate-binding protein [Carnobacterium iners]|uniref:Putative ABC transport system substrate-binding protein n=1 Tax=Carnobacterium iners TaxID=1073423 RepID=A0A1X7NEY4_9LACT|nr:tryptophan ABC transporter substrate-binding protein [Carnobacterium iners]SEK38840.1 putative ABC transport system substrate-binding protein [Carnobacterium iners]SMH36264.1 putative ABC transport system substrate-binding protein [Carnobacterium iners]